MYLQEYMLHKNGVLLHDSLQESQWDVPGEYHHSIEKVPGVAEVAEDTANGHDAQQHLHSEHNVESQLSGLQL